MRKLLIVGGAIAALAIPSLASAETYCQQSKENHEVAGTVIGAIAGGLIGNSIGRGGGRAGGTAIGAVGGAVIGNRIAANASGHCPDGYSSYEDNGPPPGYEDGRPAPAGDYGHDSAYDDRSRDATYGDGGTTWRDGDGRICHWRDVTDSDMNHRWVQACH
jgi:hypothetical protein